MAAIATKTNILNIVKSKLSLSRQVLSKAPMRSMSQIYTETGGVVGRPEQVRFGLTKVTLITVPFLWAGAAFSKNAAAFLEENDIFVPEDDDD